MITTLFTNPLIFTYLENFRKVIVFFLLYKKYVR